MSPMGLALEESLKILGRQDSSEISGVSLF